MRTARDGLIPARDLARPSAPVPVGNAPGHSLLTRLARFAIGLPRSTKLTFRTSQTQFVLNFAIE